MVGKVQTISFLLDVQCKGLRCFSSLRCSLYWVTEIWGSFPFGLVGWSDSSSSRKEPLVSDDQFCSSEADHIYAKIIIINLGVLLAEPPVSIFCEAPFQI